MFEKNSIGRNAVAVAVATALAAGTSTAIAQDDGALEEIIVTATKREASVNDISVSVTALGEEAMRLGGVEDITRLEHLVPGMRMGQSGNEARIAMRGTRTNAVGSEAEQVVGIFGAGSRYL
jgi:outer membrane cobalamin receptor